jgi:hypothetical protein
MTAIEGLRDIDETSLTVDVRAGTFGPDLEAALGGVGAGYTLGHWPQSMDLSTVGGWLACRGAGQYSTRYGKIEDMVIGLEVVLADGRVVRTGGRGPRSATGPDLTQLFVGSEGTLGVITEGRFRVHPVPYGEGRRAFGFPSFADGLDACRRILRRGATPAVLRLYDNTESARSFDHPETNVLIVLDEADPGLVEATLGVVDAECRGVDRLDDELVDRWLEHRNDVSALAPLWRSGIVVDTVEVAARWSALPISPTPTPTAPASTSPSPASPPVARIRTGRTPPDGRARTTGGPGTRSPGPPSRRGGRSATITESASTGPASWPRRWEPASTSCPRSSRRSIPAASSTPASWDWTVRSAR